MGGSDMRRPETGGSETGGSGVGSAHVCKCVPLPVLLLQFCGSLLCFFRLFCRFYPFFVVLDQLLGKGHLEDAFQSEPAEILEFS